MMIINTILIYMKWVWEMKNKEVRKNIITVPLDNTRRIFWQTFQKAEITLTHQPGRIHHHHRRSISLCDWFRLMSLHLRRHTNWSLLRAWIPCRESQQFWTFRHRKSNTNDFKLFYQMLGHGQLFQSGCQTHLR